jgi:hypothetical protein
MFSWHAGRLWATFQLNKLPNIAVVVHPSCSNIEISISAYGAEQHLSTMVASPNFQILTPVRSFH